MGAHSGRHAPADHRLLPILSVLPPQVPRSARRPPVHLHRSRHCRPVPGLVGRPARARDHVSAQRPSPSPAHTRSTYPPLITRARDSHDSWPDHAAAMVADSTLVFVHARASAASDRRGVIDALGAVVDACDLPRVERIVVASHPAPSESDDPASAFLMPPADRGGWPYARLDALRAPQPGLPYSPQQSFAVINGEPVATDRYVHALGAVCARHTDALVPTAGRGAQTAAAGGVPPGRAFATGCCRRLHRGRDRAQCWARRHLGPALSSRDRVLARVRKQVRCMMGAATDTEETRTTHPAPSPPPHKKRTNQTHCVQSSLIVACNIDKRQMTRTRPDV